MPEDMQVLTDQKRARLIEDVRRLLFEGMQKAEKDQNWTLFNRYVTYYCQMVG